MHVTMTADGGLELSADGEAIDQFMIALGRAGVAVRHLEKRARTLESLFFELTGTANGPEPNARTAAVARSDAGIRVAQRAETSAIESDILNA